MASVRGRPKKTSGDLQWERENCKFQVSVINFLSAVTYAIICTFLRYKMLVYLQNRGWMMAPFGIADAFFARPKSMSLTLNGCNLWLTSITLSNLMSVCVRPMILKVWRAVASWGIVEMMRRFQHWTSFMALNGEWNRITTCWTINLIDFRGKGWYDRAVIKSERVCSRCSKTRQ